MALAHARRHPRFDILPCPACFALTARAGGECAACTEPLFTTACECGETLFAGHAFCITCGARQTGLAVPWAEGTPVPRRAPTPLPPTVPFWRLAPDEVDAPAGQRPRITDSTGSAPTTPRR